MNTTDHALHADPSRSVAPQPNLDHSAGRLIPALPAVALVLLPKCPMCFMAWFGVLGAVDMSPWVTRLWGMPLSSVLLGTTIFFLLLRARRYDKWRAAALGLIGSIALFSGKFFLESPILLYGGLIALVVATFWSAQLRPYSSGISRSGMSALPTLDCSCQKPGASDQGGRSSSA